MASRESLLIAPAAIPVRIRAETSPFLKPLRIPEKSILSLSCVRAIVIAPVFHLLKSSPFLRGEGIGDTFSTRGPLEYSLPRSEERRVGKECRSRWSPYH